MPSLWDGEGSLKPQMPQLLGLHTAQHRTLRRIRRSVGLLGAIPVHALPLKSLPRDARGNLLIHTAGGVLHNPQEKDFIHAMDPITFSRVWRDLEYLPAVLYTEQTSFPMHFCTQGVGGGPH